MIATDDETIAGMETTADLASFAAAIALAASGWGYWALVVQRLIPPILMLLKANDDNHPVEMQDRFFAAYQARRIQWSPTSRTACRR